MTKTTRLLQPVVMEDVSTALIEDGARVLGGGTDLVPNRTWGLDTGDTWVKVERVSETREITQDAQGRWVVGAAVTLAAVMAHPELGRDYPLWITAIRAVATPEIRTQATIGGNLCLDTRCRFRNQPPVWRSALTPCFKSGGELCYAAPASRQCVAMLSSDSAPALVALGAEVGVAGPHPRWMPVSELYSGDGYYHLTLGAGEWVHAVRLPANPPVGVFRKWRGRATIDFPEVNVAVSVSPGSELRVVKIVVSALGPAPVRVPEAENLLATGRWTQEELQLAADLARRAVHPYDNGQLGVIGRQRAVRELVYGALSDLRDNVWKKGVQG